MKKITLKDIIVSGSSVIAGILVTIILISLISIKPLKNENKKFKNQLKAVNAKYSTAQAKLEDKNNIDTSKDTSLKTESSVQNEETANVIQELENYNKELEKIKNELSTNQTALETSKKELATYKAELDKTKLGIQKLKDLEGLFDKYDSQFKELDKVLNGIMIANTTNKFDNLQTLRQDCNAKCNEIKSTYASISAILNDLKTGKY